ncbi:MAG: hypothetical protein FIA98_06235 [Anaerolineae bacterium]|nr:hypothetical protein [Anaerolineae bacterium]
MTLDLLNKYGVDYVILGQPEMNYIQHICNQASAGCTLSTALRKLNQVLEPVFKQGNLTIFKVP